MGKGAMGKGGRGREGKKREGGRMEGGREGKKGTIIFKFYTVDWEIFVAKNFSPITFNDKIKPPKYFFHV